MTHNEINIIRNEPPAAEGGLLDVVNATIAALKCTTKYKRIIESIPGCEILNGKKVLMVDDVLDVLQPFVPSLTVATSGNASFIHYQKQAIAELVEAIVTANPDIVLMDYRLSMDVSGDTVIREILKLKPDMVCIGFSSEKSTLEYFMAAGAKGVAQKNAGEPDASLRAVAEIIATA